MFVTLSVHLCVCVFAPLSVRLFVCSRGYVYVFVLPSVHLCVLSPQGIDVKSMGRIFIGLVKCGAWGCFDEFNRLEERMLSAVSQQIQMIQEALKNQAEQGTALPGCLSLFLLVLNTYLFVRVCPFVCSSTLRVCSFVCLFFCSLVCSFNSFVC